MDKSSDDYVISDLEVVEFENKIYCHLQEGKYQVKCGDHIYQCPFCSRGKKKGYSYQSLLQHTTDIGSSNKSTKVKENHRILAIYLVNDASETPNSSMEPVPLQPRPLENKNDLYVWPWVGILVNLPDEFKNGSYVGDSGRNLKAQFAKLKPLNIHMLWNFKGFSGNAIVDFGKSGLKKAMAFDSYFRSLHLGREEWNEGKSHVGIHGWLAQAADYDSGGIIGDHLKKNGDLKTVNDVTNEESCRKNKLLVALATQIEVKNRHLQELEYRCNKATLSLDRMKEERDNMLQTYNEGPLQLC